MKVDVDLEKLYKELFELKNEVSRYSGLITTYRVGMFELTQNKKYITKKYIKNELNKLLDMGKY